MTTRTPLSKVTIKFIISQICASACLNCGKDINKSFNHSYKWKVPLCRDCRLEYFDGSTKLRGDNE